MSERPDYITCIRCGKGRAWCWRDVSSLFHFETIEHAAQSQLNGDRLLVCPECRDAVGKALDSQEETQNKKTEKPPAGEGGRGVGAIPGGTSRYSD